MTRFDENSRHEGRESAVTLQDVKSAQPWSPRSSLRSPRRCPRKLCARGLLCFSRVMPNGRADSAACPVHNVSVTGIAFEYDAPLKVGSLGTVCYKATNGVPIMIGCTIKQCRDVGGGKYLIGARLDRTLASMEESPDRSNTGREVGFVARPRKLHIAMDGIEEGQRGERRARRTSR